MEFKESLKQISSLLDEKNVGEALSLLSNMNPDGDGEKASCAYLRGLALMQAERIKDALVSLDEAFSLSESYLADLKRQKDFRDDLLVSEWDMRFTLPLQGLILTALCKARMQYGDLQNSIIAGRRALPLLRQSLPKTDGRLPSSIFTVAFAEYVTRNLSVAERLTMEAKDLWTAQNGSDCIEVSTCLNNLGRICEESGRMAEGIAYHKGALAIRRAKLGIHPETGFSLGNLGTALASNGQWKEAAATLQECLDCYAACGRSGGHDIEGYRANLEICRQALAEE